MKHGRGTSTYITHDILDHDQRVIRRPVSCTTTYSRMLRASAAVRFQSHIHDCEIVGEDIQAVLGAADGYSVLGYVRWKTPGAGHGTRTEASA